MVDRLTKDQQWKKVIQGLALGCLILGEDDLPSSKIETDFAFAHAWRSWPSAGEFPSVKDRDFFIYARKSDRRNGAYAAFDWRARLVPYTAIEDWGASESMDVFVDGEAITREQWVELAELFVSWLKKHDH